MKFAIAFTMFLFCVRLTNAQTFCNNPAAFADGAAACDATSSNYNPNCLQISNVNGFDFLGAVGNICNLLEIGDSSLWKDTLCPRSGLEATRDAEAVTHGFASCDDAFDQCCTSIATPEPTTSPSSAPTTTPSAAPTKSPTTTPSAAPSGSPTTSIPTGSPIVPTFSPTDAPTGPPTEFFADPLNIALVAGGGGGGLLLLAALAFIVMRRRRSGSPPSQEQSVKNEMRGAGNAKAVSFENIFDWEKHIDKRTGEVYFFNPKTGESRWDPPELAADAVQKSI